MWLFFFVGEISPQNGYHSTIQSYNIIILSLAGRGSVAAVRRDGQLLHHRHRNRVHPAQVQIRLRLLPPVRLDSHEYSVARPLSCMVLFKLFLEVSVVEYFMPGQ